MISKFTQEPKAPGDFDEDNCDSFWDLSGAPRYNWQLCDDGSCPCIETDYSYECDCGEATTTTTTTTLPQKETTLVGVLDETECRKTPPDQSSKIFDY